MPMRIAVLGKNGEIEYIQTNSEETEPVTEKSGMVLFPFQNTKIHSDSWKASDHARIVLKKMRA